MSQIQQSRYDQLLRRVADLKGPGSKVNDALTELFPMIDVERVPDELLLLSNTRLCVDTATVNPAALEIAKIMLFNPVGSGKLATVTAVYVGLTAGDHILMDLRGQAFSTEPGLGVVRDTRVGVSTAAVCQVQTEVGVATITPHAVWRTLANTDNKFGGDHSLAVLGPGSGLLFGTLSINITMTATFFWRERQAEPSELNF